MGKVDECSTFRDDIVRLYVDECYNVPQTCEELKKFGHVVSRSTLVRFLQREDLYRKINPHPRDEKKRRALAKLRPEIERMYVDEQMSFHRVNDELLKAGHKFSTSMLRGFLIEWGVGRSLSEADAIRRLQPRPCQSCGDMFAPKSGQHQCCEVCSPRDWCYWYKFKLTPAMYNAFLVKQGGLCALCPRVLSELPSQQVHVDHCHKTNVVRGILCSRCNLHVSVVDLYPGWGKKADVYVKGSL
jgi:hypothetical protein